LVLIKKFEPGERQSYKLASIAQDYLPHMRKLTYTGSLEELYRDDFVYFIRYNIRDVEILEQLEEILGYVDVANGLRFMSTGYMSHIGGTVKLADLAVRNFCWYERNRTVVPDYEEKGGSDEQAEGATVLEPKVGFHRNISNVDVTSLYPRNIMTTNTSPEKIIGQFSNNIEDFHKIHSNSKDTITLVLESGEYLRKPADEWPMWFIENNYCLTGFGTVFNMDSFGIFPSILLNWFNKRIEYQQLKKKATEDAMVKYYDRLQYIMKIKLNSFYGALLNKYFRFYDYRLGSSTTGNGREILLHQCSYVNYLITGEYSMDAGAVIYGDTDSLVGPTLINTNNGNFTIEELFFRGAISNKHTEDGKEYSFFHSDKVLSYDKQADKAFYGDINYVYRHKVSKAKWEIEDEDGNIITITDDHSIMVERNGVLMEMKASEINIDTDYLISVVEIVNE